MDQNSEIRTEPEAEVEIEAEAEETDEPEALTSAEQELIVSQKRDTFYKLSVGVAIVFFAVAASLITAFKLNEDFFDANSRLGLLMESINAQEENDAYPKINVKVEFDDRNEAKLVIPLGMLEFDDDIVVREEFTKNKLIIKLAGASEYISDGIKLTSDSQIMDAVGVYRQNLDVFVEVYCRAPYSYVLSNLGGQLTVSFFPLKTNYDAVAVVYLPFEDRNRFALPEWQQRIMEYAAQNRIRLFMASNMQEPYTEQEIIEFAEKIDADMVLGIKVSIDPSISQTVGTAVCNTTYFLPDFNSAQLSVVFAEAFLSETPFQILGFEEANEYTPLVYMATCPASMLKVSQTQREADSVEAVYKLNEELVATILRTLGTIYSRE